MDLRMWRPGVVHVRFVGRLYVSDGVARPWARRRFPRRIAVMLAKLLAEIERQGGYEHGVGAEPVVDLELFFDGNDDPGSIGCNLIDHPGPAHFYAVLRSIRDRPDVHGVWIGISEVMAPDEWPFS